MAHKRPYPGDWGGGYPNEMKLRPPGEEAPGFSHPPVYMTGGGWGDGGEFEGYYDNNYSQDVWGQGRGPEGRSPPGPAPPPASLDFTDDYSAFYGGQPNRGGPRGRGQQRGPGTQSNRGSDQQRGAGSRGRGMGPQRGGSQSRGSYQARGGIQQNQQRGGAQNRGGYQQRGGASQRGGNNQRGGGADKFRGGGQQNSGTQRGGRGAQSGQRGMPPNQFGYRGKNPRGGKKPGVVPPVHSLAKPKATFLDLANMSMAEKLHRFCLFLRQDDSLKINAIQTIINATSSSKLGLMIDYDAMELTRVQNRAMYTGVLKLGDIFLARSVCPSKKELKQEVFQQALNVMLSKTVAEIYNLADPGVDAIREELKEAMSSDVAKIAAQIEKKQTLEEQAQIEAEVYKGDERDLATALQTFIYALNNMKTMPDNPISIIEQAMTQTKVAVKHQYLTEAVRVSIKQHVYLGALCYGPIIIGRGRGLNKKLSKTATYQNALDRIKTLDLRAMMVSIPEEPRPEMEPLALNKLSPTIMKLTARNMSTEEKFTELIKALINTASKNSSVNVIDINSMQNGLTPMVVYRCSLEESSNSLTKCEFYLENILISSAESPRKKDCMYEAYNQAFDILTSTDITTILTQHKKITDEELKEASIIDVIVKGSGRTSESNIGQLKRYWPNIPELESHKVEDMVIIENLDWCKDRRRNAFSILQYSTVQNGLVTHWETESEGNVYKCTLTIQKQMMGMSYGTNKHHSRNLAATDALFRLYETQKVVKLCQRDDEKSWINYITILSEAQELKKKGDIVEPVISTDEKGNPLPDPFIMKVLMSKVQPFVDKRKTDELIFGPGIKSAEATELRYQTRLMNMYCDTRQHNGEQYMLIYEKLKWPQLMEKLKVQRTYGKYMLVDKSELPKHADIADNIQRELPSMKMDEED